MRSAHGEPGSSPSTERERKNRRRCESHDQLVLVALSPRADRMRLPRARQARACETLVSEGGHTA